jgi:hypothetical protein
MSIERLYKAASAAGFAMATPDDDVAADTLKPSPAQPAESRALALATERARFVAAADGIANATSWLRSHLPAIGWRAPA